MPACPSGSEPKPGDPAYFYFSAYEPSWPVPNVAQWLTHAAMGIPDTPQPVADLCSIGPPDDLPTTADYVKLAFPPIALATGTYGRFGNLLRARAWADLCRCKQTDYGMVIDTTLPADQIAYRWFPLGQYPDANQWVGTITYLGPNPTPFDYEFQLRPGTGPGPTYSQDGPSLWVQSGGTPTIGQSWSQTWAAGGLLNVANRPINPVTDAFGVRIVVSAHQPGQTYNVRFQLQALNVPAAAPAPTTPAAPTDYPAAPVDPTCTTIADLCAQVAKLAHAVSVVDNKVSYLSRLTPPQVFTPQPVGAPIVGSHDLDAPPGAVGLVVDMTTVPVGLGSVGDSPITYWNAGFATLRTAFGFLPSTRLTHRPMVIMPLPASVTGVTLELNTGISATVTWLISPK
jgi:hypothetical protein